MYGDTQMGNAGRRKKSAPVDRVIQTMTVQLYGDQVAEVREAAVERAKARGSGRADASAEIREAVDEWLAKRRGGQG